MDRIQSKKERQQMEELPMKKSLLNRKIKEKKFNQSKITPNYNFNKVRRDTKRKRYDEF